MTNLLLCMEDWTNYIEDGHTIDIIYTDFAKSFDRVLHQRLLQKIKYLGHLDTSKKRCTSGIGFGPILFVIFINDMLAACVSYLHMMPNCTEVLFHGKTT